MSVSGQFGKSLNQLIRLPNLRNHYCRDTWIWRGMEIDPRWRNGDSGGTGTYIVHFERGKRSSIQVGGTLVPLDSMAQPSYVRGSINQYKRYHTAIELNQEDIWQQENPRLEETFITYTGATELERNKKNFMYQLTWAMLNGYRWMKVTNTTGLANNGEINVDDPSQTTLGERLDIIRWDNTRSSGVPTANYGNVHTGPTRNVWVGGIDINAKKLTLYDTRANALAGGGTTAAGGGGRMNLSSWTTSIITNNEIYLTLPGAVGGTNTTLSGKIQDEANTGVGFTDLRSQVFIPGKGGGSSTLFGQEKAKYPYLQSILTDGSGVGKREEFVDAIADTYFNLVKYGQPIGVAPGNSTMDTEDGSRPIMSRKATRIQAVMSLDWHLVLQKYFRDKRSAYFKQTTGTKINYLDASSFTFMGVDGTIIDAVGVKAMPNDIVYVMGTNTLRFATLGLIKTYKDGQGNYWHHVRDDNKGYRYITDHSFYGDLILKRPAGVAGIYGLPSDPGTSVTAD